MAPRRGGSFSFDYGGSGGSGSSDYNAPACSNAGPAWWGLSNVITSSIFLGIYFIILMWHLVFVVRSKRIKGMPMLLRFRFGSCLFCFFLSSFLETVYTGSYTCSDMEFYDYITGMIPTRIFLHIAWLFLVFVVLFPMSRAIRLTRKMLLPQQAENKVKEHHTHKNIERTVQGILLIMMIIAITVHLFIHTLNQVEVRRYPPSRYKIFMSILLLRSVVMIIDTIVFSLVDTQSLPGLFFMSLLQKCLDALLLVLIFLLTKAVRMLGDLNYAAPTASTQTVTPVHNTVVVTPAYPYPQSPQQTTTGDGASNTGQSTVPLAVPIVYPSEGHAFATPQPGLMQNQMVTQAPSLPQGQWVFVPHEQVPLRQK
ncbi:hypothetical protein BDW69DRAFT_190393 [Aspergillus filifer]